MRNNAVRFLLSISLLFTSLHTHAQNLGGLEQGIKPYGAYEGGDIDSISMSSGSVTLHIPLLSYPQRGGKLRVSFSLVYANPMLQPWATCNPRLKICTTSGYNVVYGQPSGLFYKYAMNAVRDFPSIQASFLGEYYMASDPDGAVHQLGYVGTGSQYRSVDATGYLYVPGSPATSGVLTDRDGTLYQNTNAVNERFEDTNGNIVTTNSSSGKVTGWTDTMGRVIPAPTNTTSTTDLSHCPDSATTATLWTLPGPNSGTSQYKFCWATIGISFTPPDCTSAHSGCQATSTTSTQIVGLVLPNLTAWTFAYDSVGELTTIGFPTGGSISYAWTYAYGSCIAAQYVDPLSGVNTGLWPYRRFITSRTVNDETGSHTWNYAPSTTQINGSFQTVVTAPLVGNETVGDDTVHKETALGGTCSLYETETDKYSGSYNSGTLLQTIATTYNYVSEAGTFFGNVAINVVPNTITTTDIVSGKVSKVAKTYDAGINGNGETVGNILYGELLNESDYDFEVGTTFPLLRQTNTTYMALSGPNANQYLADNELSLPYTVQIEDSSGQLSLTQYNYDESALASAGLSSSYQWVTPSPTGTYRGNNTSVLRLLNTGTFTCPNGHSGGSNGYLTSKKTFFDDGMLNTSADPCLNTTTYAYNLTYWGALATTVTNALQQNTTNTYDINTSLLATTTDPNSLTTSYSYDDMWRISEVDHPDGGKDVITHQETTTPFSATLSTDINSSQKKVETNVFDGLGRVSQNQLTSDPQGTVYTDTSYDTWGRVATISNPYRTGTDATTSTGTTTYGYDALNRKTSVTYPDNAILKTAYCGPSTLVTDPTGRWRRSRTDALGRLVEVDEPNALGASVNSNGCPGTSDPIWVTSYTVDGLGRLGQVVQNGSHTRTFSYDSISRLLTAVNPENSTSSNPLTYAYNPDSTLASKTDARSIKNSYTWDALHRPTGASYSNGDPAITFAYDQSSCLGLSTCQNIGHRTSMTDGAGSESWAYEIDRTNSRSINQEQRTTSSITKTTTYYLDLADNITQLIYPTGRTLNYSYDSADRPSSASDPSITYVSDWETPPASTNCTATAVCYTPQGSAYGISLGQSVSFTGLNILETFNNRLQPNGMQANNPGSTAFNVTYNFVDPVSGKNAGHVYGIIDNGNSGLSQTFTYDQLNRITSAGTTYTSGLFCWGYLYSYDSWGNLLSQAAWTPNYNNCTESTMAGVTADGNNHISGFSYDTSGNTQNDGVYSYTWDAESQLKTAGGVTYSYDGDGRRAAKVGSKLYWYGSGGEILAETDASGNTLQEYVYFSKERVALVPGSAASPPNPLYYVEDFLGSSRMIAQSNGTICYYGEFTPYGGELPILDTCAQNYKFEGKERDTETANDDFGAREYSWRFGRWLSSDWSAVPVPVPYANLSNPQTLNLYSMVADDPESFADLDGHEDDPCNCSLSAENANRIWDFSSQVLSNTLSDIQSAYNSVSNAVQSAAQTLEGNCCVGAMAGPDPIPGLSQALYKSGENAATQTQQTSQSGQSTPVQPPDDKKGGSNVRENKAKGDAYRDQVADSLKAAGRDVSKEVSKKTPFGRRVIDVEVTQNGKTLGGVETKTGNSRYTPQQRAKDNYLKQQGYPVHLSRKPNDDAQ